MFTRNGRRINYEEARQENQKSRYQATEQFGNVCMNTCLYIWLKTLTTQPDTVLKPHETFLNSEINALDQWIFLGTHILGSNFLTLTGISIVLDFYLCFPYSSFILYNAM